MFKGQSFVENPFEAVQLLFAVCVCVCMYAFTGNGKACITHIILCNIYNKPVMQTTQL